MQEYFSLDASDLSGNTDTQETLTRDDLVDLLFAVDSHNEAPLKELILDEYLEEKELDEGLLKQIFKINPDLAYLEFGFIEVDTYCVQVIVDELKKTESLKILNLKHAYFEQKDALNAIIGAYNSNVSLKTLISPDGTQSGEPVSLEEEFSEMVYKDNAVSSLPSLASLPRQHKHESFTPRLDPSDPVRTNLLTSFDKGFSHAGSDQQTPRQIFGPDRIQPVFPSSVSVGMADDTDQENRGLQTVRGGHDARFFGGIKRKNDQALVADIFSEEASPSNKRQCL